MLRARGGSSGGVPVAAESHDISDSAVADGARLPGRGETTETDGGREGLSAFFSKAWTKESRILNVDAFSTLTGGAGAVRQGNQMNTQRLFPYEQRIIH